MARHFTWQKVTGQGSDLLVIGKILDTDVAFTMSHIGNNNELALTAKNTETKRYKNNQRTLDTAHYLRR